MAQPPFTPPSPPAVSAPRPSHEGNLGSIVTVGAIFGVLAVLAAGVIIVLVSGAADDTTAADIPGIGAPTLDEADGPAAGADGDGGGSGDTEPSPPEALPTDDGPTEAQYVDVATKVIRAARAGHCDAARVYTDDVFDAAIADENLCRGSTRKALRGDNIDEYVVTYYGNYGAAVEFDGGHTFVSLVAQDEGDPLVQVLIAY